MYVGPGDVLQLIRAGQARTRGDIQEETGMSRMTVAQRVDSLLKADLIREAGTARPSGGRRPTDLAFNLQHSCTISASVETTSSRVALTDLGGTILVDEHLDMAVADGPEKVLRAITEAAQRLLKLSKTPIARVSGVGISIPGPVDPQTLRPSQPPIMPGWDAYPVVEFIQEVFPVPVLVENDADAMAVGEYSAGFAGIGSLCLVKVSTGIGTGLVIDGKVYQGVDGGAGDIGHVRHPAFADLQCQCGSFGCLAAGASGGAIARKLTELGISSSSGRDVREQLVAGNMDTMRLTHEAGRRLGEVMATVVCLLNPAVLLIAGDLASSSLIGGIRETLYPMSLPRATRHLDVRLASLGEDAGIRGMSSLLVNQVFSSSAVNARLA
ncbi:MULTISPECIES: ROK family transcriptional regulator [unclassified Arthrobacter]|uniref:ROK family transcriptional regulator n=1 Tax=unclassified Arthrobacter TaxID=235627 RepID=UPI000E1EF50C|nr:MULTISPECIES: ROK family transcriptional regulator [unclassified Arthrobacter]MDF2048532.1 ROK family transcriptional regulator [Arthrobacter sp. Cr_A7]RDV08766.1 ROK family transcriptional regulator [Arthrobacter sp. RT-1]